MHLPVGTTLQGGKYKIVRFLSSGGFGCTYEAEHTQLQSHVALKEFFVSDFCNRNERTGEVSLATQTKAELLGKLRKKFIEEARAVFQMHHQHIVRVLDIFEENGTAYYAMDYIDGQSLHEMVKMRGKLPESEAVKYILQIADALKYVHSLNRLHLDIKPGNIMVDKNGNAILIDFGASKHYDDDSGENTSTLLGVNTKGYAPVELMNSSFSSFSPSADIYSLGATLYKLLTGITPPSSLSLVSDDEELEPLPSTISKNVRDAVSAAMQLKRKARPQSIEAFVSILDSPSTVAPTGALVSNAVYEEGVFNAEATKLDIEVANHINGYEYVDLGLSVKWATCNVGAKTPSSYGNYYAWGETSPKSEYTQENSVTYGKGMGNIAGDPAYDAARANWGGTWRLPTASEIDELVNKCKHTWTTQGRHKGLKITGPNGNSIFLPAAGSRYGTSLSYAGEFGRYWSANQDNTIHAAELYLRSSGFGRSWLGLYGGQSVRPVSE